MKSIITHLGLFFVLITCLSCHKKDKKEIENDYLTTFLHNLAVSKNAKWVVILPGLGCHGCIQEGEIFMKENIQNKKIFFVLTSIESLKILQNKIDANIKNYPNVYADMENQFNLPTDNGIYPCIIQLDGSEIKEYEFQAPQNSQAFSNLKSRIQMQP